MELPADCKIQNLTTHVDPRGQLTEIFRASWIPDYQALQWNFVRSRANVLRGVHVHVQHSDYLVCLAGTMVLGLVDIRPESPTTGMAATITLTGSALQAALIPPGVAHGFHFPEPSLLCYSTSHYWNTLDEIGCRWDDPALGLDWTVTDPELSLRDQTAESAEVMTRQYLLSRESMLSSNG